MRKLYQIPAAVALAFGLTVVQGAEPTRYHTSGYKPAQQDVLNTLACSNNHFMHKMSKKPTVPDRTHITELASISKWPAELVYNQGNFGTCTANSAAFATCYMSISNSKQPTLLVNNPEMLRPSRWYTYYNTRYLENKMYGNTFDASEDTGASIAGSILAMDMWGCCPEDSNIKEETVKTFDLSGTITYKGFPYTPNLLSVQPEPLDYLAALDKSIDGLNTGTPFTNTNKPVNPYAHISQALQYKDLASAYRKFNSNILNSDMEKDSFTNAIISSLQKNHPVMAGVMLDESFMKGEMGYIPTPDFKTFHATGGHAIPIVGFGPYNKNEPTKTYFKFLNSWGLWGDGGFGYFEEAYFSNVNKFSIEAYEVWLNPTVK